MFEHLGSERGLPHPVTMSLVQDGDGYLWFGTQYGLARWDGYRIRTFLFSASDPGSLPANLIQTLHVDRQGRLWVGTTTAGVAMYDKLNESFVRYAAGPNGLSGVAINAMASDDRGGVWVGGAAGLDYIDTVRATITHHRRDANVPGGARSNQIRALLLDRGGNLWIGSNGGLARRDAGSGKIDAVTISDGSAAGAWSDAVLALAGNASGQIVFGTLKSGVGMIDAGASEGRILALNQVKDAGSAMVLSVAETLPGQWWAATYGGGIIEFDGSGRSRRIVHRPAISTSLAHDRVAALWRDRSGLIWVANERGIDTYNPGNRTIETVFDGEGLLEISVLSFMNDSSGRLWVALGDQGIDLVDADGTRTEALRPDPANPASALPKRLILAMVEAEPQEAWIGTQLGLYRTSAHGRRVTRVLLPQGDPLPRVRTILRREGVLWLGTAGGLLRYDPQARTVQAYVQGAAGSGGLSDNRITSVVVDADGALWVGTINGLNRLDPATGKIEQVFATPTSPTGLSDSIVNSLVIDARGRLWVGTNGGGICILEGRAANGTPMFRRLGRGDGLPNEIVVAMHPDQAGRIWASTISGIAAIDSKTLRAQPFGRADGLVFQPYFVGAAIQTPQSDILFGTSGGFTIVHPNEASKWTYQPPLVVSAVRLGTRTLASAQLLAPGGPGLTIPPDTRGFEIEVAALDFSASQRNRYAFWLEGYDKDWVETDASRRLASYNNLAPGRYRLRMRGSNRDGVWSPHELAMQITVVPAWYQTWWARTAGVIGLALLVTALVQWRTRYLRYRKAQLESKIRKRTRALETMSRALQQKSRALELASLTDPLTGLHNRRYLSEHIDSDVALVIRHHQDFHRHGMDLTNDADLIFFLIDIDHFKQVNDQFGHSSGDAVLIQMRDRLRAVFRDCDHVVRWGGEEFLIVVRGSKREQAPELAERVRSVVANQAFLLPDGKALSKTCSIGFACFPLVSRHASALDWSVQVDLADAALYRVKRGGRNGWFGALAARADAADEVRALAQLPCEQWQRDGRFEVAASFSLNVNAA
ncbi:MAG: two-component regulator propeller domain-containing protein [Pseudomonadota bacterium]